ncbi:LysR substrate-binding domain-containing protein [Herbaspirillum sp. WGmk3]|uniref:LysR family transcriptional regulator n=1 Tax=Herbaspirillum sp. WGmk3 TaxID=2919925 RepID=UPI0020912042|nr:LysR family transcriptional regulator [Herbaspirillum sp. WGmk3]MCO4856627.1 LysR substrate-binding domain-containing protein [Herbaspirillum sp. WGmk3]
MHANLSTRLLHAFLALADCRHFGHAAERCHVSQSAFSAMIQKLETATGARLFERDTRNVSLTPEGEVFVEVARQLVADMEAALADMNDYVARRKGRVAIAALPSLAAGWLPPVLAAYRQRHPGVAVELFDAISDQCLDLLRQGKADIALTAPGPNLLEFTTQPLCADPFYLVCRKDHALAGKRRIKVAQLAGCEMIHLARSTSVRQHLDAVLRPGAVIHTGLEVEHLATLAALIESGLGVSVVPELTLFQFRLPNLVAIPMDAPELVRPLLIVTPKERSLSIAAQGLLELVQAKARAEAGAPARRNRPPQRS